MTPDRNARAGSFPTSNESGDQAPRSHHSPIESWLPIATAPRDGTDVLVSNGTAVWQSFHDEDGWEPECVWGDVCPTHWQPLPAPPLPAPPEVTP